MKFEMPKLEYPLDGLEPYLSKAQVDYHYSRHTKKYFDTLNELIKGTKLQHVDNLAGLVGKRSLIQSDTVLFNNAAQAFNHSFYWQGLCPSTDSGEPSKLLLQSIKEDFGSKKQLETKMIEAGKSLFGSGWVWLVHKDHKLHVRTTANAQTPASKDDETPLLCIDVWEHAYLYQDDYVADRAGYLKAIWHIINWKFVSDNYEAL